MTTKQTEFQDSIEGYRIAKARTVKNKAGLFESQIFLSSGDSRGDLGWKTIPDTAHADHKTASNKMMQVMFDVTPDPSSKGDLIGIANGEKIYRDNTRDSDAPQGTMTGEPTAETKPPDSIDVQREAFNTAQNLVNSENRAV